MARNINVWFIVASIYSIVKIVELSSKLEFDLCGIICLSLKPVFLLERNMANVFSVYNVQIECIIKMFLNLINCGSVKHFKI